MVNSLRPYGLAPSRLLCHGILQARTLEWVATPSSRVHKDGRSATGENDQTQYILMIERTGFIDRLDVVYKKKTQDDFTFWALSKWKIGTIS